MYQRRLATALLTLLAAVLLAGPALAQGAKHFAVLPFEYNGPDKYKYFPKAFQANLRSNLEWPGKVEPASESKSEGITPPKNEAGAINALRSSGLDYLVTGSISILGKEATLGIQAYGLDGSNWSQKGQMPIDEITPWLDAQSRTIMGDVFKRPGYSTAETMKKKSDLEDGVQKAPTNQAFISATSDQYQADTLNPQFRYEGGTQNIGRWRSQTLRFFTTSMVVGDADGDGQNEVVLLHDGGLSAYRFKDGKLEHLGTTELPSNITNIRLELVDVNNDDINELIVSSYQMQYRKLTTAPEGWPKSYVFSFKDGRFEALVSNYGEFLGVLRIPPAYKPVLVSQELGTRYLFDNKMYEAFIKDGKVIKGQSFPVPPFGSVFNIAYLPDEFGYKFVVIDDEHRLKVYSQTLEALYSSDTDKYNSSGITIESAKITPGLGVGVTGEEIQVTNIPFRMAIASLSQKGKYEVLVNKDLSVAAEVFERFKYFTQGEIHSLAWDGVGLNLAWKTRRIKGQVSDITLADLNNDGKKQLCVLVNTFPGNIGFSKRKTIVLAYDLNM